MNLLTALFSTVGYCLLMNVPRNKIVPASINGMLSWGLYLLLKDHIESVFYLLVVVASFTAAYSEVAAKIAKTPATVFRASFRSFRAASCIMRCWALCRTSLTQCGRTRCSRGSGRSALQPVSASWRSSGRSSAI